MKNIAGNKSVVLVNGAPFPVNPTSDLSFSHQQPVDSARNVRAQVIAQKTNRRLVKLDSLQWSYLTREQWIIIRRMIENFEVVLTYYDDYEDNIVSRKFYFGDSSAKPFEWDSKNCQVAVPLSYVDCKVNIIDMGY